MRPIIEVRNISKSFGRGQNQSNILKDISLEIFPREYVMLFGQSGCGKSTLLNCISGLEKPETGEVLVRNRNLHKKTENELAIMRRDKIGMVFQQFNLLKEMSVLDNIAVPQLFRGVRLEIRRRRAMNLLKQFELEHLARRRPAELSGGQQQRVAICRALINNCWIFLVDEPTGNLDSKNADEVMKLIDDLNRKKHRTILLVTHNPDYLKFADKIYYMKDGRIVRTVEHHRRRRRK